MFARMRMCVLRAWSACGALFFLLATVTLPAFQTFCNRTMKRHEEIARWYSAMHKNTQPNYSKVLFPRQLVYDNKNSAVSF